VRANPITALAASPWARCWLCRARADLPLRPGEARSRRRIGLPRRHSLLSALQRDGATLLAAGGKGVQLGIVALFDVHTGKRLATLGHEMDSCSRPTSAPMANLVALGGPGKIVRCFPSPTAKSSTKIKKHTDWITAVEFSPDGKLL